MTDANPLLRYLVPLRRWWPIVAVAVALGVGVAWITLPERPQPDEQAEQIDPDVAYRATHILLQGRSTSATDNFELVVMLARQNEVLSRVTEALGDRVEPGAVQGVQLEADEKLGTLLVTAVQPTPELAALVATTYAREIIRYFDEQADTAQREQIERVTQQLEAANERIEQLIETSADQSVGDLEWRLTEAELNVLVLQYGDLQGELQRLSAGRVGAEPSFVTLEEPTPVSTAASDAPFFEVPSNSGSRIGLAALMALLLGVGLVIAIDRLDGRVRSTSDAEAAFGLPVLAEVPRRSRREQRMDPLPVKTEPGSDVAESFRALRLAVQFTPRWRLDREAPTNSGAVGSAASVAGDAPPRAMLVTSPWTGEGKSTVAANLAASIAESGQSVLVVDCDFRRSRLHELLGVEGGHGLHDRSEGLLLDSLDELAEQFVQPTAVPGVSLVRAGGAGSAPPWFLPISDRLVQLARDVADVVVFDTGPILVTNEATALIPYVDAVLVVARNGRTSRDRARRATEQLARLRAMVAGVVFVGSGGTRYDGYYQPLRRTGLARMALRR